MFPDSSTEEGPQEKAHKNQIILEGIEGKGNATESQKSISKDKTEYFSKLYVRHIS